MENLETRKAIFYPTEIVLLKKKGNITIHVDDIYCVSYHKPKLHNYLPGFNFGCTPKLFEIDLKKEICGKKWYGFSVDYKVVLQIQKFFQKEIIYF